MRAVEKAVEKADGDLLDAGVPQNPNCVVHPSFVGHGFDPPVMAQPFRHFSAQPALDEHRRFVRLQIIKVGPFLPADFEKVVEAVTADQTGQCAAMLNERIGRHCRPTAE